MVKHQKTHPKKKAEAETAVKKSKTKIKYELQTKKLAPVAINQKKRKKYDQGVGVEADGIKTNYHKKLWAKRHKDFEGAITQTARTEILLNEDAGCLIPDEGESTADIKQSEIVAAVDITATTKHFELALEQFGPYRLRYTKNGRHLLLAGAKGHVAAVDWMTKRLNSEINVMESITDVSWLHTEQMYGVAQKNYVHIYDNKGTELHCVKKIFNVNRLEFLNHHFLLAAASETGFLSWLDVSIGELVAQYNSKQGNIRLMAQNVGSGILYTGDSKGIVNMWSPSEKEPLAYVRCHKTSLAAVAGDCRGKEFVTCGLDRIVRVWDYRNLGKTLNEFKIRSTPYQIDMSQKGLIAVGVNGVCEIYKRNETGDFPTPYMRYVTRGTATGLKFCPYEDVLGIATQTNFVSILVPGAGEPNFDAFEANPYQSKSQRRETEVKNIIEKVPMDLIKLDPDAILKVNVPSARQKIEMKKKIMFAKPPKLNFTPRMKKKSKNSNKAKRKQIVQEDVVREFKKTVEPFKKLLQQQKRKNKGTQQVPLVKQINVLDRFKRKEKLN